MLGFVDSTGNSTGPHLHYEVSGQDIQGLVPEPILTGKKVSHSTCGAAGEESQLGESIAFRDLEGWVAEAQISTENIDVAHNGPSTCSWAQQQQMGFAINANFFPGRQIQGLAKGSQGSAGVNPTGVSNYQTFTVQDGGGRIGGLVVTDSPNIGRAVTGVDLLDITQSANLKVGRSLLAVSGNTLYLVSLKQATIEDAQSFMSQALQVSNYISLDGGSSTKAYVSGRECFEQSPGANVPVSIGVVSATINQIVPESAGSVIGGQ